MHINSNYCAENTSHDLYSNVKLTDKAALQLNTSTVNIQQIYYIITAVNIADLLFQFFFLLHQRSFTFCRISQQNFHVHQLFSLKYMYDKVKDNFR